MDSAQSPARLAAFTSLFAAAGMIGFWYVYLFVGNPSNIPLEKLIVGQLRYSFSADSPVRWQLSLQAIIPLVLLVVGVGYLRSGNRSKKTGAILLLALIVATLAVLALRDWGLAILLCFGIYGGVRDLHGA